MKEKLIEAREFLAVKWFMLDAQQKQAVIICAIAFWEGMVQVISARLSQRVKDSER